MRASRHCGSSDILDPDDRFPAGEDTFMRYSQNRHPFGSGALKFIATEPDRIPSHP